VLTGLRAGQPVTHMSSSNNKPLPPNDLIISQWTKSSPILHCSRSCFTRIYVTTGKKRL